ncbi:phytochrome-interacting ankyrin-repeat protein [Anaeramoeba ignava]|uniref:Phytochrome-interacting ankyrin-repeat protein n=1 Tax=Anaeramoeba ignava TaxID=1746090 RepID=A0A9Q0LF74_ANAIG|nr:phytochrome-interacting ankyrin-repeat protein [Anaeramoeba ignava]
MKQTELNKELISKCENGTFKEIENLILKGANVNSINYRNETPLHLICRYQQNQQKIFEIIKYLIENGAGINSLNSINETPLHYACQKNSIEIIKYLIENGADINSKNNKNETSLHYSFKYHQENLIELIKYLIKKGSDINSKNNRNETPLHYACRNRNKNTFEIIKYLIKKGAYINSKNNRNETPLYNVCRFQDQEALEIIKYLISKGADINSKNKENETLLHYISRLPRNQKNTFEIIKYLIENKADINSKNSWNATPLHLICKFQDHENTLEIIKYLIEKGADINSKNYQNEIPLHLICQYQDQKNSFEIAKYLIKKGANVNINTKYNKTPLYFAIKNRLTKIIKYLLMNDANILYLKLDSPITSEIIEIFNQIYSINDDLNNLLKSNENLSDFQIQSNDSFKFQVHKQFLLLRFYNNETILQKFIDICSQKSKEYVQIALNFLYTGFTNFDNYIKLFDTIIDYSNQCKQIGKGFIEGRITYIEFNQTSEKFNNLFEKEIETFQKENEIILTLFKEIGIDSKWIEIKKGRKGIIKDLSKLYEENETKDFKIIFDKEKEIKVHKLILIIRSELFKGMFLNVQDSSNQVHDYSGKSFQTIQEFIYFIYHDKFSKNIKKEKEIILEEYFDLKDYYQLNQNSIIDLLLKEEKEN